MRMKNIIRISVLILLLAIVFCIYIFQKKTLLNDNVSISNSVQDDIKNDKYYFEKLIQTVVRHNVDYNALPLTRNFKQKFNTDIFGIKVNSDLNVTYEDSFPYISEREKCNMWLWTSETNNEVWLRKIHYTYNENYELDDLDLIEERLIMNAEGYGPHYDVIYTYGNSDYESRNIINFLFMPFMKGHYDKIETTKHFNEKFPEVEKNMPIKIDRPYLYIGNKIDKGNKFIIWIYDTNCHYEYEIEILTDKYGTINDLLYKYIKTYEGDTNNIENYQNMIENDVYKSNEW